MSKPVRWTLFISISVAIAALAALFFFARSFARRLEPEIHARVIQYLEKRFNSKVTLAAIDMQIPKVSAIGLLWRGGHGTVAHIHGHKLELQFAGQPDLPPLFTIDEFSFDLDLGMLREPAPRVPQVTVTGMTMTLPPRNRQNPAASQPAPQNGEGNSFSNTVVEKVDITAARLVILPNNQTAKPLDFDLQEIHLSPVGKDQQMGYRAVLTNPRPPGLIHSSGLFGPWDSKAPGDTKLEGDYTFSGADLSVFEGIGGRLHSTGHFAGSLTAILVRGEATVPDFYLKSAGNRVPLATRFDVMVDGMNGNTVLQPVHARLLKTEFQTSGAVIQHAAGEPRAIQLNLLLPSGHIEDLLLLATKGKPVMSGLIHMNAKIAIPPLRGSVKQKLRLAGTFAIHQGEFARNAVQDKIDELSRRGQGRPKDESVDSVFSAMAGDFALQDQVLTLSRLSFSVPGADVALHGNYRMLNDTVDFHGDLKLRAKVSQTLTGWKHWLAKPFDPIFEKHGAGTYLKIEVVGSASNPKFGRDHPDQRPPN